MTVTLQLDPMNSSATITGLNAGVLGAASTDDIADLEARVSTLEGSSSTAAVQSLQDRLDDVEILLTKITETFTVSVQLQQPTGSLVQPQNYSAFVLDQKNHFGNEWWTGGVENVTLVNGQQQINFKNGRWLTEAVASGRLILDYPDVDTIARSQWNVQSVGTQDYDVVKQLQRLLYETGDSNETSYDGNFDSGVVTALNAFKGRQSLTQNGLVDGQTWVALSNDSLPNWHV